MLDSKASIALLCLVLAGCGGKSSKADSAADEAESSGAAQGQLAELAGTWSGSAYINGYGTAVASATLDGQGKGSYFVSIGGNNRQGFFRIVSWDGSYLLVETEGHQERIHATHQGDKLWVDNALIGQVLLRRSSK